MTTPDPHDLPPDEVESQTETEADRAALAASLRALQPSQLDSARRAAILQAAVSRAAGRRRPRWPRPPLWPSLAASFALVALVEGALLAHRPAPVVVERIVVVRDPTPVAPAPTVADRPPPPLVRSGPDPAPSPTLAPTVEPEGPLGWSTRLAERPPRAVAPRLPSLTGPELRRTLFRLSLETPGGSS